MMHATSFECPKEESQVVPEQEFVSHLSDEPIENDNQREEVQTLLVEKFKILC